MVEHQEPVSCKQPGGLKYIHHKLVMSSQFSLLLLISLRMAKVYVLFTFYFGILICSKNPKVGHEYVYTQNT